MPTSPRILIVVACSFLILSAGAGCGGGRQANPILARLNQAKQIADAELRAIELSQISSEMAAAGDMSGAAEVLSSASSAAGEISDAKGRAEALNAIALAYGK
ncbi:MAG: hypothetical protein KDA62_07930, partial [Planctomycetales bacterium]|nr:hypothetical protein [Planctomycetales bacterium]